MFNQNIFDIMIIKIILFMPTKLNIMEKRMEMTE